MIGAPSPAAEESRKHDAVSRKRGQAALLDSLAAPSERRFGEAHDVKRVDHHGSVAGSACPVSGSEPTTDAVALVRVDRHDLDLN